MKTLTLVKFGHEYCGPCRTLAPVLKQIAAKFSETLEYVEKDTYSMNMEELEHAKIKAVPTIVLLKNRVEVWRHVGLMSQSAIEQVITSHQ